MKLTDAQRTALVAAADRGQISADQAIALTLAQCAADGLFWLKFVRTRDEADPANAIKPFPVHLEYVKDLWGVFESSQRIVIAKSRQMLVSWCVAAFMVWWARFKPNQACYLQTKAWEDAVGMIAMPEGGFEGRAQFIESHLPDWMKYSYKASEGRIQYSNGSIIQALAGGADKIRGKTASLYVGDEMAFQEDQDGVVTALLPLIQKGSKAILVSTPNGSDNMFCTLYHGRSIADARV